MPFLFPKDQNLSFISSEMPGMAWQLDMLSEAGRPLWSRACRPVGSHGAVKLTRDVTLALWAAASGKLDTSP